MKDSSTTTARTDRPLQQQQQPKSPSHRRRRVIFPQLHHDDLVVGMMTPTKSQQRTENDPSQTSRSLSNLESNYSSLPCLEAIHCDDSPSSSSSKSSSSPSSSRRKIFDFDTPPTTVMLELFPPLLRRRGTQPQVSTPFSPLMKAKPILKRSSYERLDSVPSLSSITVCDGDDEEEEQNENNNNNNNNKKHDRRKVLFHPQQVSSYCEFQRSHEELECTWWSSTDIQLFQIAAMAKVFGWGAGTTSMQDDDDDPAKKSTLFTHPALAA